MVDLSIQAKSPQKNKNGVLMKKRLGIVFFLYLVLVGVHSIAWGHAAVVWAYAEGSRVFVEAFFASGKKIQNATVVILDKSGKEIIKGKTDKDGKFSYTPLSKETQTVVVSSGDSHVGDFELLPEDLDVPVPDSHEQDKK